MSAPGDDGDVNAVEDDYEDGDVNAVEGGYQDADDNAAEGDYEDGDVNAVPGAERLSDDTAGNRSEGGLSTSVLGYLARSLANEPDAVVIQTEQRPGTVRLRLHVAPDDMGRVIGRRGRTAQAIRTLVGVAGAKDGVQASVDIVDD